MAIRVLVVNDTQEILDLFREILAEDGYEVVLYSYAIEDMAEIERIAPDLIILDYIFGYEKSGWQMLQKLKMTRATETIPVIVCTAATREVRDIQGYLQAHGIRLLPKPFGIDELSSAVRMALQDPRYDAFPVTEHEQEPDQEASQAHEAPCEANGKRSTKRESRKTPPAE